MTIHELCILIDLHSDNKISFLDKLVLNEDVYMSRYNGANYFFIDSYDGKCYLFDKYGNVDDINKVKSIDEDMIPKDIENIIIPDSVISITNWALFNCRNLTNVTIPDCVTSIGNNTFSYCSGLTNVTIPDSVTSIGGWAFEECSGLTDVTIPDSVTSIRKKAFRNCSGLTSMTIGNGVTSIGYYAFYGCSNLKDLIFKGKTIEEVQAMKNYPFGIKDESIIRCEE